MIRSVFVRRAALLLTATVLATACGQKGPLYLPGKADSDQTTTASSATATNSNSPQQDEPDANAQTTASPTATPSPANPPTHTE